MVATLIKTSGNALFGHRNYVLSGVLGASASVATFGVGQLQNEQGSPASAWQTPIGTTSAFLTIDAGSALPWRLFGLFRTNLTGAARVRWRLGPDPTMIAPVFDSGWLDGGVQPGYQQHVFAPRLNISEEVEPTSLLIEEDGDVIVSEDDDGVGEPEALQFNMGPSDVLMVDAEDDPVVDEFLIGEEGELFIGEGTGLAGTDQGSLTARYCRVDIEDAGNPDLFLNIPLVYAGDAWEPGRQISSDSASGTDAVTDEVVARSGAEYPVFRYEKRRWDLAFASLPDDEVFSGLEQVMRVARRGANVLFVPFPREDKSNFEAVFGRLTSRSDVTYPSTNKAYRAFRASVTERL